MKKFICSLFLLMLMSVIYANPYEGYIRAFRIVNGVETAVSVSVKIIDYYNNRYQVLTQNGSRFEGSTGTSFTGGTEGYNGFFSVEGQSEGSNPGMFPAEIPHDIAVGGIIIVIGDVYITWYADDDRGDTTFFYDDTNKSIYWINAKGVNATSYTTCTDYSVSVRNSFNGGQVQFFNNSPEQVPSGNYLTKPFNSLEFPVSVTALPDQTAAEYYLWNNWSLDGTNDLTKSLSPGTYSIAANFDPAEKLIFQGTSANIEGTTVLENGSIKEKTGTQLLIAINSKVTNSILYSLDSLYRNNIYHTGSSTFYYTPQSQATTTFNAVMKVTKPVNNYRSQYYGTTVGAPIVIYWTEHPSSLVVGYEVWRTIKDVQSTRQIATINSRTITSYTDTECTYTSTYSDNLIYYDVRAKLSNNVTSDNDFIAVFGRLEASKQADNNAIAKTIETVPTEYSIGNYPNPFNPTTVIRYTMPEAGMVSLKVYNVLSQEIADLVGSNQSAGVHQVNFNASHLPTGIYIARLQAGAKIITVKLQLVK